MKITRNPIVDSVRVIEGSLFVVSEVEVPEAPGGAKWLKPRVLFDPTRTFILQKGESPPRTPAERLARLYERAVADNHRAIENALVALEAQP